MHVSINHMHVSINHMHVSINHMHVSINHMFVSINHMFVSISLFRGNAKLKRFSFPRGQLPALPIQSRVWSVVESVVIRIVRFAILSHSPGCI